MSRSPDPEGGDHRLTRFFEARSLAVIGASDRPGNLGGKVVTTLIDGGWDGELVAVNSNPSATLAAAPLHRSVSDLDAPPDVVLVAVPGPHVLATLHDLAALGVSRVAILTSGFAEAPDGRDLEAELVAFTQQAGMTVLGPNCEGFADFSRGLVASFGPNLASTLPGPVSIVSQSGGLCTAIARRLHQRGIGIDRLVSTGNECDVLAMDAIRAVAASESTKAIAVYVEQVRSPRAAIEAIAEVTAVKPVVMLKAGRTDAGTRAAMSHTGAIAGPSRVLASMLEQAGVVVARHTTELIDLAAGFLGSTPLQLAGNRVAVLSQSGGAAVETADLCREAGLAVPVFERATQRALQRSIPSFGAVANPVDFTAAILARPELLVKCVGIAMHDPNVDLGILALTSLPDPSILATLGQEVRDLGKPVLLTWLGSPLDPELLASIQADLRTGHVSIFDTVEGAVAAARAMAADARRALRANFVGGAAFDHARLTHGDH